MAGRWVKQEELNATHKLLRLNKWVGRLGARRPESNGDPVNRADVFGDIPRHPDPTSDRSPFKVSTVHSPTAATASQGNGPRVCYHSKRASKRFDGANQSRERVP